jgi:hypothetical protein
LVVRERSRRVGVEQVGEPVRRDHHRIVAALASSANVRSIEPLQVKVDVMPSCQL